MAPISGFCRGLALLLVLATTATACSDWANALNVVNQIRASYGAPKQTYNTTLAAQAQAWAQTQAAKGCQLAPAPYDQRHGAGENLYAMYGSLTPNCTAATRNWALGASKYKYTAKPWTDNQANFSAFGQWSQLVWKASTQIGCGSAVNKTSSCYVVTCRYYPAGNVVTNAQFLANVGKPVPAKPQPPKPPAPKAAPKPPAPKPPAPKATTCVDQSTFCPEAAAKGWCTYYWTTGGKVKDTCPKSCKICS